MSAHQFTDAEDRIWDLEISLAAANRIDACDFTEIYSDQVSFLEPPAKFFEALLKSTALQFAIIWYIVKPQADALQLTQELFCESIKPRTLTPAKTALWGAIADFFPHLRTSLVRLAEIHGRQLIRVDQKLAQMGNVVEELSDQEVDKAMEKCEQEIREALGKPGTTSTDSPQSPA